MTRSPLRKTQQSLADLELKAPPQAERKRCSECEQLTGLLRGETIPLQSIKIKYVCQNLHKNKMIMLSHIRVSNDLTLNRDDSRLHALVGQNGSGKTFLLKRIANDVTSGYAVSDAYYNLDFNSCVNRGKRKLKPQLQTSGRGLAEVLDYMSNHVPNDFHYLEQKLQQIVSSIEKIKIHPTLSFSNFPCDWTDFKIKPKFYDEIPAYEASESAVLITGLLATLLNPFRHNLILLDNLERNLHSTAQRELMNVFKEILRSNPNLHIIFSTHSPYIVDKLTHSQVHVLSCNNSGVSCYKRLDEHPDAEWAKQTLTTGEFWDSVGEDWVTQG